MGGGATLPFYCKLLTQIQDWNMGDRTENKMGCRGTSPAAHFLASNAERFSRIGRITFITPSYR